MKYLAKTYGPRLVKTPVQTRMRDSDPVGSFEGQTALHLVSITPGLCPCLGVITRQRSRPGRL